MSGIAVLVQWVALTSLVGVLGAAAIDLLVVPADVPELDGARRALGRWIRLNVIALTMASLGQLLVRTRTMSGGDLATIISAVPSVLAHTHFGMIWIGRFAALIAVAMASPSSSRLARLVVFVLAAGLGLTASLTGHAADWGDLSVTTLVDYGHVLGAGIWMGGLFALALVLLRVGSPWSDTVDATVARRFSRLAGVCLSVVVLSGAYNGWTQVRVWAALWTTTYGQVLLAKILFVLLAALLGAVNRFAILPGFDVTRRSWLSAHVAAMASRVTCVRPGVSPDHVRFRLRRIVIMEAALGLVILMSTAVLTETTPARHAIRMQHGGHAPMAKP